jgi:5'-nucleotidase
MTTKAASAPGGARRFLLVNDDGFGAPGLVLLEELVRRFSDDVWVVAPDDERSGSSHSISLTTPVRIRQMGERRFALKGSPTDCVLMAIWELMGEGPPVVVLSGINRGANLADDITYSGTAGPAMEGALLGLRSIALSQIFTIGGEAYWETARKYVPQVLERLLSCEWQPGTFVNVNFPDVPPEGVTGTRVTTLGMRAPGSFRMERRTDARNVPYYWVRLAYREGERVPGTDLDAAAANAISITPLHLDLTARDFHRRLEDLYRAPAAAPAHGTPANGAEVRR